MLRKTRLLLKTNLVKTGFHLPQQHLLKSHTKIRFGWYILLRKESSINGNNK